MSVVLERTLTPALSLSERERENPLSAHETMGDGIRTTVIEPSKNARRLFPLPIGWGEGQGEGQGEGIRVEVCHGAGA